MSNELIDAGEPLETDRINELGDDIKIGDWYWVNDTKKTVEYDDDDNRIVTKEPLQWLGCVVRIGTNYAKLEGVDYEDRVHFDDFEDRCKRELNYRECLERKVEKHKRIYQQTVGEIQEICARLGVAPREALPHVPEPESKALSVIGSGETAAEKYKAGLIKAKDETLPALHEKAEKASSRMAEYLAAETISLGGQLSVYEGAKDKIDSRIFNLKLYAGLTEQVHKVLDGQPADSDETLHVYQAMKYMDVEAYTSYTLGGICCESIEKFDKFIAKPENFNRILPQQRCLVAFRTRYREKQREAYNLRQMWVNMQLAEADKWTWLYIRNGEQLYRFCCDLDFGGSLFPNAGRFDLSEPMLCRRSDKSDFVSVREKEFAIEQWKQEVEEWKKTKLVEWRKKLRLWNQWCKKYPHENDRIWHERYSYGKDEEGNGNPYGHSRPGKPREPCQPYQDHTEPFNSTSVYFDDMGAELEKQIEYFNRIGLIIQGLYDRSEILHPHPPYKTWQGEGFKLIYDQGNTLYDGDPPDIEEYIEFCNSQADENSYFIGQEDLWLLRGGERESNRRAGCWNWRGETHIERYSLYGDPGPGMISQPETWKPKAKKATFRWKRPRLTERQSWRSKDEIDCSIEVPLDKLFNVSAYEPGDYRMFFDDPRTRTNYLRWGALLLYCEEWHAGNKELKLKRTKKRKGGKKARRSRN